MEDYYYDCSGENDVYGDRRFISLYTSYGIKCIDSEYSRRIQNIGKPVLRLIKINRTHHYEDGTYRSQWWDDYTDMSLDEDFKSYDRSMFIHDEGSVFIELEDKRTEYGKKNNIPYQQFVHIVKEYCYTHPTYSAKHKGEDPKALRKEIRENPHLHKKIKQNLLGNLKNRLK